MVKSPGELLLLQRAADISGQVLEEVIPMISPATRERDIAAEISCRHLKLGAQKDSFDPIVASGFGGLCRMRSLPMPVLSGVRLL